MSGYWQCALVCEGRSDEPLAETLQSLMLACRPGDDIAVEVYRPEKAENRSVAAKLAAIAADDVYDLIFVHRDADSAGWEARAEEIRSAGEKRAVPVIPVRMTETWALTHLWAEEECRKCEINFSDISIKALMEVEPTLLEISLILFQFLSFLILETKLCPVTVKSEISGVTVIKFFSITINSASFKKSV